MTTRNYFVTTSISAIFSWTAWFLVLFNLNPYESSALAIGFFFLSLFFASVSTLTVVGLYIRKWLYKNIEYTYTSISLRQAVELTFCILGSLMFLMLGVLTWWDGLLLVIIIILFELYFSSKEVG